MSLLRSLPTLKKTSKLVSQSVPAVFYHPNVLDHYENPRNVGSLDKNDSQVGTGLVGAPACGDVMKLQIKVDENGKIVDAKFKTFGCGSAIASSSLATEWVKGKTVDEALKLKNTDIAKELCLPPVKLHCSIKHVTAQEDLVPPDGGWGWLVLLASVMVNLLIPGTVKSFGVLFVEFLEVFDASPAAAAWIPALSQLYIIFVVGPLSSVLSVKYSYRTVTLIGGTFAAVGMMLSYFADSVAFLCISYGVLVGIGAGLAFPPTVYIVTSYFVRLRGLANGLCISGSALGSIFLPPILGVLLREYGYRGAVLIMGAVTLNVWASALLYEPVEKHMVPAATSSESNDNCDLEAAAVVAPVMITSPVDEKKSNHVISSEDTNEKAAPIVPKSASSVALEYYKNTPVQGRTRKINDEEKQQQQENKFFDFSLLKDPIYLVILISNSTNAVSYTNFVILLPAYAISLGFDKNMSSLLLSTVSILDLIGRIGGSALSDVSIMPKHWYFVGGLFISGISLAILPIATTYTMLSVYCGIFGLASGIYVGITAVIMADMLGTEKLTSSYGISLFVNGIIQLVGPPICGIVFEQIGSYGPIFSILGVILVVGASLWGFVPFIRRRQDALEKENPVEKL
ncbi:Iron-sulfur cluster assembly enzyme ISCU, mitochondrial [Dufourea novaeangliae]|uniref:Iron-sulfur cluster assembly enzyme ISCU n=2 Tax=Apocrita TaxID=7400 RepID=A0A154PJA0_DUFNO|nr:Iron-sulfur cluster assembly enzyme ISCU, mitochondrial [Dufourea novaeangliae]